MRASVIFMAILSLSAVAFATISVAFNLHLPNLGTQTRPSFGTHLSEVWASGDPIGGGGGGPGVPPR